MPHFVPVCCPHELWMMKEWINYWRMIEFHIGVNHWRTITRVVSSAIKPLSGSKYHYLSQQAKITPDCIRVKIRRPLRPIAMLELKWDGSGCWGYWESAEKARRYEFVFPLFCSAAFSNFHSTLHTRYVYSQPYMTGTLTDWHTLNSVMAPLHAEAMLNRKACVYTCLSVLACWSEITGTGVIMSRKCSHKCRYVLLLTNCFIIQPGSALRRGKAAWNVCKFA